MGDGQFYIIFSAKTLYSGAHPPFSLSDPVIFVVGLIKLAKIRHETYCMVIIRFFCAFQ
jgi:hypothetical protein